MHTNRIVFALIASIMMLTASMSAQELNAIVSVNTPQLTKTDPQLIKQLEGDIQDFLNTQSFTDEEYEPFERIDCNFQLTIRDEIGGGTFTADLAIQASRPVYNSEYETVLLSFVDSDVKFNYAQGERIQFAEDGYINNLSSILSYWSLVIIGLDYDSFKPSTGTPFFEKASTIVNAVPSNVADDVKGWRAIDSDRNRYWFTENMLNPKVADYRIAMYRYHRQGLDLMHADVAQGRSNILAALNIVKETRDAYPNNMIVQLFAGAKTLEIVDIMAKASRSEQKNVFNVLSSIDPANRSSYIKLR